MDDKWIEIIVGAPVGALERAEAALHTIAPLGLYIEDYSDLENTVRQISGIDSIDGELAAKDRSEALIHVYFAPGNHYNSDCDIRHCIARTRDCLNDSGLGGECKISFKLVAEEDWANNWKQYFKPLRVGKGILILPEWEVDGYSGLFSNDCIHTVIRIDPGMAFGTGGHITTRLCLELVENYFYGGISPLPSSNTLSLTESGPAGCPRTAAKVLDIGCGSGILSIAAALLGAGSALGIDIDGYAVRNARENAVNNGVSDKVKYIVGDLASNATGRYDLIIANIVADVVIRLFNDAGRLLARGGQMIISGVIGDREADVVNAARAKGLTVKKILCSEDWVALQLIWAIDVR